MKWRHIAKHGECLSVGRCEKPHVRRNTTALAIVLPRIPCTIKDGDTWLYAKDML